MIQFGYKEKSWVSKPVVVWINRILLFLLLGGCVLGNTVEVVHLTGIDAIVLALASSIISSLCVGKALKDTVFYEWDVREREKKKRFTSTYTFFASLFSILWVYNSLLIYYLWDMYSWEFIRTINGPVYIILEILLPFNLVNIPSQFFFFFEDIIESSLDVRPKPDGWDGYNRT